jgi:hypothetical protein
MGRAVSKPLLPSVDTVARLQEGLRSGLPVLIPGSREGAGAGEVVDVIADPAAADARAAGVFNRIRFEREPARVPERTFFARLWRRVYRGPDVATAAVVK